MRIEDFWSLDPEDQATYLFDFRWRHTKRNRQFLLEVLTDGHRLVQPAHSAFLEVLGVHYQVREALPFIRSSLAHTDATVRYFACDALGWIGDEEDLPLLAELFEDHEVALLFGAPVSESARSAHDHIRARDED